MEISEVEERKNQHIDQLIKHHERAFNEMRNYYNDITLNNLALISTLKDQMEVLRKQNERMSKQCADLTAENKRLTIPLKQALDDVAEYKRQLQNYEKDKISLANTKALLQQRNKELDDLRWAYDSLELRFASIQEERDVLHDRFVKAVIEVQQKTGAKNVLLQKRIQTLSQVAEHRDVVIGELSAALAGAPPQSNKKLEKNAMISDLQYDLARVCKAHDDLLETFQEKLAQYGIPQQDLGFTPLRIVPDGQCGLARGPAALLGEGLTWLMVYRTEKYQKLKAEVEKQSKKLEKRKETHGDSLDKHHKKKIEREEERLKNNNRDLSFVKMKSMFAIGFAFTALLSMFNTIFDGRVVARLPFLPLTWIQGLSHRNLPGEDYYDCSFIFLYILCTMSIRQNIQKLLGFAPSRAASKQGNSLFGPTPGQFK
nr:unnamed protein product [Callosobruchus analis]